MIPLLLRVCMSMMATSDVSSLLHEEYLHRYVWVNVARSLRG